MHTPDDDNNIHPSADWATPLTLGREAIEASLWDVAEAHFMAALDAAVADKARGPEASACGFLAQLCLRRGDSDDGLRWARRARDVAEAMDDAAAVAHFSRLVDAATAPVDGAAEPLLTALGKGLEALEAEDHATAVPLLEEAVSLAGELGQTSTEVQGRLLLARALFLAGRYDDARTCADAGMPLAGKLGASTFIAMLAALIEECKVAHARSALQRAVASMEADDPETALKILEEAETHDELVGIELAWNLGMRVRAMFQAGRTDDARTLAKQAHVLALDEQDQQAAAVFSQLIDHEP